MQNHRLFEIIYILLDRKKVTARELADKFEVSVRTIYRDIDALSYSGIPVYATKGKGGGISLMDDFVLQKSLLTEQERNQILIGLQSLRAAQYPQTEEVITKLNALFRKKGINWIEVDFSDWGQEGQETFLLLKTAVLEKFVITFDYFGANGKKTTRTVEPLRLLYKGKAWYLQGYCRERLDFRFFKLSRMKKIKLPGETFCGDREPPCEAKADGQQALVKIVLRIGSEMAYRVYDEFDERNIRTMQSGFEVELKVPEDEWAYGYILSFGGYAKVLAPERIAVIIKERLKKALEQY